MRHRRLRLNVPASSSKWCCLLFCLELHWMCFIVESISSEKYMNCFSPLSARDSTPMSGTLLVKQLLQMSVCGQKSQRMSSDSLGLTSLLHFMSTSATLACMNYSRGKDASFLSPEKPKRWYKYFYFFMLLQLSFYSPFCRNLLWEK